MDLPVDGHGPAGGWRPTGDNTPVRGMSDGHGLRRTMLTGTVLVTLGRSLCIHRVCVERSLCCILGLTISDVVRACRHVLTCSHS